MELEFHQLELKYAELRLMETSQQARLAASLLEHGQVSPVLVVESAERFVLIDGYRRVAALRELGRDTVRSVALALDEVQALLLMHRLQGQGRRTVLEEAWLVRELVERHGKSLRELGADLGRSASWVSRRLALLRDLPEEVEQALRQGRLSPQAAMKHLVPLARANAEHCRLLVNALGSERVSVRELGRLYAGWRIGSAAERQRIVTCPRLYLQLDDEAQRPPLPVVAGEENERALVRDLGALAGLCRRLRENLRERRRTEAMTPLPAAIHYAWQEARAGFEALAMQIQEVSSHA